MQYYVTILPHFNIKNENRRLLWTRSGNKRIIESELELIHWLSEQIWDTNQKLRFRHEIFPLMCG